jgi:hypothetical protein
VGPAQESAQQHPGVGVGVLNLCSARWASIGIAHNRSRTSTVRAAGLGGGVCHCLSGMGICQRQGRVRMEMAAGCMPLPRVGFAGLDCCSCKWAALPGPHTSIATTSQGRGTSVAFSPGSTFGKSSDRPLHNCSLLTQRRPFLLPTHPAGSPQQHTQQHGERGRPPRGRGSSCQGPAAGQRVQ